MAGMPGNTAWPEALPTVHDLDHSIGCDPCQDSDTTTDLECGDCGRAGTALIVRTTYSTATAHCPTCGAEHSFPNDHDDERA